MKDRPESRKAYRERVKKDPVLAKRLAAQRRTYRLRKKERLGERYLLIRKAAAIIKLKGRQGRLFRQPCCICGEVKTQAHHENYLKPYEVYWLCHKHHTDRHSVGLDLDIENLFDIRITPKMLQIGVERFLDGDPLNERPESIVRKIFISMLEGEPWVKHSNPAEHSKLVPGIYAALPEQIIAAKEEK